MKTSSQNLYLDRCFSSRPPGLVGAGVLRRPDREGAAAAREPRSCPSCSTSPEASIRRLAIERGNERLVFERRGQGIGRWQMVEPLDVGGRAVAAGDPGAEPQGAAPIARLGQHHRPAGHVRPRLLRPRRSGSGPSGTRAPARPIEPIATLAIGKTVRGVRYVRPGGTDAIEVADAKLLKRRRPAGWPIGASRS